jgi:transcriptional regulator with XRE-family HTH domain
MSATPAQVSQGQRFARWLRLQRADRGWTQAHLAKLSGVSTAYLSLMEKGGILPDGNYQRPSEEIVGKLAAALELELGEVKLAAGHEMPELEYLPDLDTLLGRVEGFNDFDGPQREVIREAAVAAATQMAESLRKLNSQGTIGSRFTREEIAAEEHQQSLLRERNTLYIADMQIADGLDTEDSEEEDDDLD